MTILVSHFQEKLDIYVTIVLFIQRNITLHISLTLKHNSIYKTREKNVTFFLEIRITKQFEIIGQ